MIMRPQPPDPHSEKRFSYMEFGAPFVEPAIISVNDTLARRFGSVRPHGSVRGSDKFELILASCAAVDSKMSKWYACDYLMDHNGSYLSFKQTFIHTCSTCLSAVPHCRVDLYVGLSNHQPKEYSMQLSDLAFSCLFGGQLFS